MDIHILPSNIANMIAAGEVVQRPASVVKELMENAVDAGATRIDVVIVDAGRTLVQVIDNGCGMTPDEAVLCFQRHATSKIASAEDLQAIETYGFRGEALASIAAVAEVTLRTRRADAELATEVSISDATADDPGRQDIRETAAPKGSSFAVRNLYYNTPARRKFLKSDASELKAIISEFTKVALSRIDIAFSLSSNGRDIYRFGPAGTLKYRIRDLFSEAVTSDLLPVEVSTEIVGIKGFTVRPEAARKTVANQFFFVNGRYFRSPYLHKAVMKAYEQLITEGTTPSYFIFLELDPRAMDINVHPTKTEIKFEDDNVLFTVLMAAVKEALGRESFGDRIDFDRGGLPELRNIGESFGEYRQVSEPSSGGNADFNPFEGDGFPNEKGWEGYGGRPSPSLSDRHLDRLFDRTVAETSEPARADVLYNERYILRNTVSGFMLVDSVRAMQRILFENFLTALSKESPVSQACLFPIEVEIGMANVPLLEANSELLHTLGFDFSDLGQGSIAVNGVPEGLAEDKMAVSAMMFELVTALGDEQVSFAASMYSSFAEKLAKSASRSLALPVNAAQAASIIDRLYACENPEFTSDGKRIVAVLKAEDLEKLLR